MVSSAFSQVVVLDVGNEIARGCLVHPQLVLVHNPLEAGLTEDKPVSQYHVVISDALDPSRSEMIDIDAICRATGGDEEDPLIGLSLVRPAMHQPDPVPRWSGGKDLAEEGLSLLRSYLSQNLNGRPAQAGLGDGELQSSFTATSDSEPEPDTTDGGGYTMPDPVALSICAILGYRPPWCMPYQPNPVP
jgi:hypothetical protein